MRLFALARLLDKVPARHFKMNEWLQANGVTLFSDSVEDLMKLRKKQCGYAGCAIGWGMTSAFIKNGATSAPNLLDSLGFDSDELMSTGDPVTLLFGAERNVTPKRVAKDIRAYLNDGTLPKPVGQSSPQVSSSG